jgi:hypothetical protein
MPRVIKQTKRYGFIHSWYSGQDTILDFERFVPPVGVGKGVASRVVLITSFDTGFEVPVEGVALTTAVPICSPKSSMAW